MPELNNAPGEGAPDLFWPEVAVPGSGPSDAGIADPAVRTILDRVRELPALPVSEHPDAYAGMHDALLEALNEEPLHEEPLHEEPRLEELHAKPQPGPGAA